MAGGGGGAGGKFGSVLRLGHWGGARGVQARCQAQWHRLSDVAGPDGPEIA